MFKKVVLNLHPVSAEIIMT